LTISKAIEILEKLALIINFNQKMVPWEGGIPIPVRLSPAEVSDP